MTPIAKNIFVIDEQGNQYEATYPKRAEGLVKSGRARFVNGNTICLACPPSNILEENKMNENIVKSAKIELTMEYILSRIDSIMMDNSHIHKAIEAIRDMKINDSGDSSDNGDFARGEAISTAVKSRETTNQQLIKLFEKMYDDLKPQKIGLREKALEVVEKTLNHTGLGDDIKSGLSETLEAIRHIND